MFDSSALWCARRITELREVGLTIKQIKHIADVYLTQPDEPIGPRIAAALDHAEHRAQEQLQELHALMRRIRRYRDDNADALAGLPGADFGARDPRRAGCRRGLASLAPADGRREPEFPGVR
jgi:DNA-binding transcriptional MerR regulator